MDLTDILREVLPAEIVDSFDLVRYKKTASQFDIWCDEKKVQPDTDASNPNIVSNGFGDQMERRANSTCENTVHHFPQLETAYDLSMQLTQIYNQRIDPNVARLVLARWYSEIERFDPIQSSKRSSIHLLHTTTPLSIISKIV